MSLTFKTYHHFAICNRVFPIPPCSETAKVIDLVMDSRGSFYIHPKILLRLHADSGAVRMFLGGDTRKAIFFSRSWIRTNKLLILSGPVSLKSILSLTATYYRTETAAWNGIIWSTTRKKRRKRWEWVWLGILDSKKRGTAPQGQIGSKD